MTDTAHETRIKLDNPAFDEMFGGGFLEGSANLISGAPGVGKTTLGLHFLTAGIKVGQPGLVVSFEQFPASLIRDADQLGWDLKAMEKAGQLGLIFTSPEIFLESIKTQEGPIFEKIRKLNPTRLLIDSAAHFQRLTKNPQELRDIYNTLVNGIKRLGMTSMILDESAKLLESKRGRMASLPFLVDSVTLLRYVEVDSSIQRVIAIMKMRGSTHQKEIRRFQIQQGGLQIGDPFAGREGILSGTTYRTG
jgi:circadian clock protein KaiC